MPSNSSFTQDTTSVLTDVGYSSITSIDYTGDGKLDILLTGRDTNGQPIAKLYQNTSNGFSEDTAVTLPGVSNGSVAWADYNGDNKPDFLLTGSGANGQPIAKLYQNTGNGFSEDTTVTLPGVSNGSVAWADYNGDNKPDFLLTGLDKTGSRITKLYQNTGNDFSEDTTVTLPGVSDSVITWADYNGDGKPDLLITGMGNASITKLYRNTGNGLSEDTSVTLPGVRFGAVAWADYNNDGKLDLLLTGRTANNQPIAKLYRNTGSGFSEDTSVSLPGVYHGAVAWADYNDDGKPDFLLTGLNVSGTSIAKLYQNTGDGFKENFSTNLPGISFGSVAWANYTSDDKPDLLLTGFDAQGNPTTQLYHNTFTPPVQATLTAAPAPVVNHPFTVIATFSAPVTNFTDQSIEVTNGTVSDLQSDDNQTYHFIVTPIDQDDVIVTIPVDTVGNTIDAQLSRTYDISPPAVPTIDTTIVLTKNNKLPLTGTAEANSSITVTLEDGTEVGTAIADGNGIWSLTPSASIADGLHTLTAAATDAAGNTSLPSGDYSLTIDTQAPDAPAIDVIPPANTDKPTITGTAEANSTVRLLLKGQAIATPAADAGGVWSFTPTAALVDGDYTLTATATDAAGNISAISQQVNLKVDTEAPDAPIIRGNVDNGGSINGSKLTLSGTAEPNSIIHLFDAGNPIDDIITDATTGKWSYSFNQTPLSDGDHTLTATATDTAGNTSQASSDFAITIDSISPTISLSSNTADAVSSPFQVDLSVEGANTPFTQDKITVTNGTIANFKAVDSSNYTFDVTPSQDGLVTVAIAANVIQDAAANSNDAMQLTRTYDNTPPAPPTIINTVAITNNPQFALIGTAEANTTVQLFQDSQPLAIVSADADGKWSYPLNAALADGHYTFTANTIDTVGNFSAPATAFKLIVDTSTPTAPTLNLNTKLTNTNKPAISGTANPNSTVQVSVDDQSIGKATADQYGKWTLTTAIALKDGTHHITATATNLAGTTSSPSVPFELAIDTIAPVVTLSGVNAASLTTGVENVTVSFSEAVTGFELNDLRLTRNNTPVNLTSAKLSTTDNKTFTLTGLTELTTAAGSYQILLTATGSGVADKAGNAIGKDTNLSWSVTIPSTASPTPSSSSPGGVTGGNSPAPSTIFDVTTGNFAINSILLNLDDNLNNFNYSGFKSKQGGSATDQLKGTNGNDILSGYGNRDNLYGGSGNDVLSGGSGNDSLSGDKGNDLLLGGNGNDILLGGDGNDILIGGLGKDTLIGGKGNDSFIFRKLNERGDTIASFSTKDDRIVIYGSQFSNDLKAGMLPQEMFCLGVGAKTVIDRFVYNEKTGELWFDVDGKGGAKAVGLAQLKVGTVLKSENIVVV